MVWPPPPTASMVVAVEQPPNQYGWMWWPTEATISYQQSGSVAAEAEPLGPPPPMILELVQLNLMPIGYENNDCDERFSDDEELPQYDVGMNPDCIVGTWGCTCKLDWGNFSF